jgi:hypothetical protein
MSLLGNSICCKTKLVVPLAVTGTGIALGLLWILSDVTSMGVLGWIVFAIVGLPLYGIAELAGEKVFSRETGERLSKKVFSWKRIWYGLFLYLSVLLIAASLYYLKNSSVVTNFFQ